MRSSINTYKHARANGTGTKTVMGTGREQERKQERKRGLERRREREREWRGGGEMNIPLVSATPHQEISRVEDQGPPFRTRHHHHPCRQEVAPSGSQQLRAQDPSPVRRCGTEGENRAPRT